MLIEIKSPLLALSPNVCLYNHGQDLWEKKEKKKENPLIYRIDEPAWMQFTLGRPQHVCWAREPWIYIKSVKISTCLKKIYDEPVLAFTL